MVIKSNGGYQQGIEIIKAEMEDEGEPLVDINFGHGRYNLRWMFLLF